MKSPVCPQTHDAVSADDHRAATFRAFAQVLHRRLEPEPGERDEYDERLLFLAGPSRPDADADSGDGPGGGEGGGEGGGDEGAASDPRCPAWRVPGGVRGPLPPKERLRGRLRLSYNPEDGEFG